MALKQEYDEMLQSVRSLVRELQTQKNNHSAYKFHLLESKYTTQRDGSLTPKKFSIICDLCEEYNQSLGRKYQIKFILPSKSMRRHTFLHLDAYDTLVRTAKMLPESVNLTTLMGNQNAGYQRTRFNPDIFIDYLQLVLQKENFIAQYLPPALEEISLSASDKHDVIVASSKYLHEMFYYYVHNKNNAIVVSTSADNPQLAECAQQLFDNTLKPLVKHAILLDASTTISTTLIGKMPFLEHIQMILRGDLRSAWTRTFTRRMRHEYKFADNDQIISGVRQIVDVTLLNTGKFKIAAEMFWKVLHAVRGLPAKKACILFLVHHVICERIVHIALDINLYAKPRSVSLRTAALRDTGLRYVLYHEPPQDADTIDNFFTDGQHRVIALTGIRPMLTLNWPLFNYEDRVHVRQSIQQKIDGLVGVSASAAAHASELSRKIQFNESLRAREAAVRRRLEKTSTKKGKMHNGNMVSFVPLPIGIF